MKTIVISGFPGVGKSHFSKNSQYKTSDSDSSKFSWIEPGVRHPDFPQNYINHIKELVAKNELDFVFVSSHKAVRDSLMENDIPFLLVYPSRSLKEEYLDRYRNRGNDDGFIQMMTDKWDSFIDEIENLESDQVIKIELKPNEYLTFDVVYEAIK